MEQTKILIRAISILLGILLYCYGWFVFLLKDDSFRFLKIIEWIFRDLYSFFWALLNVLIAVEILVWAWT